jgi:hypothetical protein
MSEPWTTPPASGPGGRASPESARNPFERNPFDTDESAAVSLASNSTFTVVSALRFETGDHLELNH